MGFGLAKRALATTATALRARGQPSANAAHLRLGEAAALVVSAHLIFTSRHNDSVGRLERGPSITEADSLRNRRDVTLAFPMIRQGIEHLVAISGACTAYDTDPPQALWRAPSTIGSHMVVNKSEAMVPYGTVPAASRVRGIHHRRDSRLKVVPPGETRPMSPARSLTAHNRGERAHRPGERSRVICRSADRIV